MIFGEIFKKLILKFNVKKGTINMNILWLIILDKLKEYLERNIIQIEEDEYNRIIVVRAKL